jgi:hypothetical protein
VEVIDLRGFFCGLRIVNKITRFDAQSSIPLENSDLSLCFHIYKDFGPIFSPIKCVRGF